MQKSKFTAERAYRITNENDETVLCFVVSKDSKQAALMALEEHRKGRTDVEIKNYKSQRSIEQNRMLWALLGKMAEAVSGKSTRTATEECYCQMLEETNAAYEYLLALPQTENELRSVFRVIRKVDEREVNGKVLNMYRCYKGSSKYDTKEMTLLIETTLDKLAELGIYDSEIEQLRSEYEKYFAG